MSGYTPQQWLTGSEPQLTAAGTVAAGQALPAYKPLGQNKTTGEYHAWDPAANDGTEIAVRITPFAIDTTSGAQSKALIYGGCFNPDLVDWPAGASAAQIACAFVGTSIALQALK